MKFLIINGPNLNLLGIREPGIYGNRTYEDLCRFIRSRAELLGVEADFYQSNHEGALIDKIHEARLVYDGVVLNAGAYTHYSYAIHDAIASISVPTAEVHISDIDTREAFRRISVIRPACALFISGHGFDGYIEAIEGLMNVIATKKKAEV